MRQEFPHHTDDQIREAIRFALELVDEVDPPSDLRPLVFNHAVQLKAAKQIMFEQPQVLPTGLMQIPRG